MWPPPKTGYTYLLKQVNHGWNIRSLNAECALGGLNKLIILVNWFPLEFHNRPKLDSSWRYIQMLAPGFPYLLFLFADFTRAWSRWFECSAGYFWWAEGGRCDWVSAPISWYSHSLGISFHIFRLVLWESETMTICQINMTLLRLILIYIW